MGAWPAPALPGPPRRGARGAGVRRAPAAGAGREGGADRRDAWAQRGCVGVGDVGSAGAAGAAGALTGGGAASRTTELPRSPPKMASVNDVSVKTMAIPVVILPSKVGVPIEPKTA